jgi:phytoene synthase
MSTPIIATRNDYREAEAITKQFATNYYRSTKLFPARMREATFALYGFVRLPDEFVDSPHSAPSNALLNYRTSWQETLVTHSSVEPVHRAMHDTVYAYGIPPLYTLAFLDAMEADLTQDRYATYKDLEHYMFGSATAVGYMMTYIIGTQSGVIEEALPAARALAEAFQMTNFLRDVHADYHQRGRIYLPQEDLYQFQVTEDHIAQGILDQRWHHLMEYEIARTRALYELALPGINLLHPDGQRPVRLAHRLYKTILDKIEVNQYDVFHHRARVPDWQKLLLTLTTR